MSDAEAIRIGVLDDISPPGDERYRYVMEAGIAHVAASGRLDRPIELVYRHVLGLPHGSVHVVRTALRELIDVGAVALLGPSISDNCLAVRDLVDELRVPALMWPGSEETRSEYCFQYQAGSLEDEPVLIAGHLADRGLERVAVVHDFAATGQRLARQFGIAARDVDLRTVAQLGVPAFEAATSDELLDELEAARPDAIAHFGLFGVRMLGAGLRQRGWDLPVVSNISASMAQNNPSWRPALEGWVYVDMVSDDNRRLGELWSTLDGERAPRGPRLVAGLDLGVLIGEAAAHAELLSPDGMLQGLEALKRLPSAAGHDGTLMGFGRWDRAALKGQYFVLRQWREGESVQWSQSPTG